MKNVLNFFLPIISYLSASAAVFWLFWKDTLSSERAFALIAIAVCIAGSFLCGFSGFNEFGKMGIIFIVLLSFCSVLPFAISLLSESDFAVCILGSTSYYFVLLCCLSDADVINIISQFFPFAEFVLPLVLSTVVPVLLIAAGYKVRVKFINPA